MDLSAGGRMIQNTTGHCQTSETLLGLGDHRAFEYEFDTYLRL